MTDNDNKSENSIGMYIALLIIFLLLGFISNSCNARSKQRSYTPMTDDERVEFFNNISDPSTPEGKWYEETYGD